jgi:chromosomal replication initiation ATPase DnaA
MVAPIAVTDPNNETEARARILAIRARQRASAEAQATRLAEQKAAKDAAARPKLTAAAERAVRAIEERSAARATARVDASHKPQNILTRISAEYGVSTDDITGPSREAAVVMARYAAIHAIRGANPRFSLIRIGQWVGRRDHTTVLHALRKIAREGVPKPVVAPSKCGKRRGPQPRDDFGRFVGRSPSADHPLAAE